VKPGKYSRGWWQGSVGKFKELESKEKYDVIHSQSAGAYYLLRKKLNKEYKLPVVVSLHGTSVDEIKTKLRLGFNLRAKLGLVRDIYHYLFWDIFFLSACDAVVATSDQQVKVIEKYYPVRNDKIHLVYNGIDTRLFTPRLKNVELLKKLGINSDEKIILSIARMKKEKGVQNIISIFPRVLEKFPKTHLLAVGEGEYKCSLIDLAHTLGIQDKVHFLGRIEYGRLAEYLNMADIFVNSTIRENGYDLTIPQAMACAKPVVSSDIKSVMTVIENGKNGFLYPRNDLTLLSNILFKLLDDAGLAKSIGLEARSSVLTRFSLEAMAEGTINVYKEVMRGNQ
jgi:glycosyltransferase involved in cell wall biosynthesis